MHLIVIFLSSLATERYTQLHTKRGNLHPEINETMVNGQLNILNTKIKVNFLYPVVSCEWKTSTCNKDRFDNEILTPSMRFNFNVSV